MSESELTSLHALTDDYLTAAQQADIERAYTFAKAAHGTQRRYSGEPYIIHPVSVACILAEMHMDADTLIAALLHDVLEDTAVEQAEVALAFGQQVADLVEGVTKLSHIHFASHAQAQAENFRKMVMAMASDMRVILVKLADRLHNMRTLSALPLNKRRRIARETLEIYAPIAHRLGMHAFRADLEELGFAALYPFRHRVLLQAIQKARGNRLEVMDLIYHHIGEALEKNGISASHLSSRGKHLYSIYRKMHEQHLSFSEIMDVYGFRIIVDKVDTCYRVLGILHNLYKPVMQRFKDYIAIPKLNGYQSLHTTLFGPYGVPIEVQIRTTDMHKMAENGIAAHWLYKTGRKGFNGLNEAQARAQAWLDDILEIDKTANNSLEFIENVKTHLFPDEVYVFTPKGEIIELPTGATIIDFAYAIHSDVGHTCVAARVDKRLTPLTTVLQSGQQIEIISDPDARPDPAWLNFVVTGHAKNKIKHDMKHQQPAMRNRTHVRKIVRKLHRKS